MTDHEKFEAFKRRAVEEQDAAYGKEARAKYGDSAVDESHAKLMGLSPENHQRWQQLDGEILAALAAAVDGGIAPDSETGRNIAAMHKEWLSFTLPQYTPQIHAGIAMMYTADQRFTVYYDKAAPGCAAFLREAILSFTNN